MDGTIMNSENWELYYKTASLYKPVIDDILISIRLCITL